MDQPILDYWQAIVGLFVVLGVWIAWRQYKARRPKTENTIVDGNRNTQSGVEGETVNTVKHGDDNDQRG